MPPVKRLDDNPTILEDLALHPEVRKHLKFWSQNDCPNLILHGDVGTGKTTCAEILMRLMNREKVHHDASRANSEQALSGSLTGLNSQTMFGDGKSVLIDEFDLLSKKALGSLSGLMDEHKDVLWIFTTNNLRAINDRVISRTRQVTFDVVWDGQLKSFIDDDDLWNDWKKELERVAKRIFRRSNLKYDARAKKALKSVFSNDTYCRDIRRFCSALNDQYWMADL